MSTYAEINNENIVVNIIVADEEFVATQTDKTYVEYTDENPAGINFTYDSVNDVFVAPQPYPSWTLDENFDWNPPTPMPTDGETYYWNEEELAWAGI